MRQVLSHLQAILALPFLAIVVVPLLVLNATRSLNPGWSLAFPLLLIPLVAGVFLSAVGFLLLWQTIRLFVLFGNGTLAPWMPTQKLVVRGIYRHVRNPMITGVMLILLGFALVCGSLPLLYWFLAFVLVNVLYVPLLEEPQIEERFGDAYRLYKRNVPRWIPRLHPWEPPRD